MEIRTFICSIVRQDIKNNQEQCKKNERLVRSHNRLRKKSMGVILQILILMTYLLNINKPFSHNKQHIVQPVIQYKG